MINCIFCRIAGKEVNSYDVYEDETTYAFLDSHPLARGHTLVIPKQHVELLEDLNAQENQGLFATVHKRLKPIKQALKAPATTIAINNGHESGQEVEHVHVHIIPRFSGDRGGPIHAIMPERPSLPAHEIQQIAHDVRELLNLIKKIE